MARAADAPSAARGRRGALAALLVLVLALAGPAGAEAYRLTRGDLLAVGLLPEEAPVEAQVDIDGAVRLAGVGGLAVAGLTLDEAERAIGAALVGRGILVAPDVTLAVRAYAPVVVAGAVAAPGRFDAFPPLTVEAALALAGGRRDDPGAAPSRRLARSEALGRRDAAGLALADALTRVAAAEARLGLRDDPGLAPADRALLAEPDPALLGRLEAEARDALAAERAARDAALAQWDAEIAALEDQVALLARRVAVQQELVAGARAELDTALDLQDRGLQTGAALARARADEADARAGVLELESARAGARRALADARRLRAGVLRDAEVAARDVLRRARLDVEAERRRLERALDDVALIDAGAGPGLPAAALDLRVVDGRDGTARAVGPEEALRPGDTLIVRLAGEGS